jgi:hypothetical protein
MVKKKGKNKEKDMFKKWIKIKENIFFIKKIKIVPFEIQKAQLIGYIRHSKFQKVQ